jgi:CRP-like cAMP-binding protein
MVPQRKFAVVGNEGVIGVALFMDGETTPSRAIAQSAGYAFRLPGQQFKDEFHCNAGLQISLLRYTQALLKATLAAKAEKVGLPVADRAIEVMYARRARVKPSPRLGA